MLKFNLIQDKVSLVDSLLVVTDDKHGINLVVDRCLQLHPLLICPNFKMAPANRHLPALQLCSLWCSTKYLDSGT